MNRHLFLKKRKKSVKYSLLSKRKGRRALYLFSDKRKILIVASAAAVGTWQSRHPSSLSLFLDLFQPSPISLLPSFFPLDPRYMKWMGKEEGPSSLLFLFLSLFKRPLVDTQAVGPPPSRYNNILKARPERKRGREDEILSPSNVDLTNPQKIMCHFFYRLFQW